MSIEKLNTKTNLLTWMDTVNELIDSNNNKLDKTSTASSASKLSTARTISLTGDVSGGGSFDGSKNLSFTATLAASGVTSGNYGTSTNTVLSHGGTFIIPYFTVDSKGRLTVAKNITLTLPSDNNTDTKVTQTVTTTEAEYPILASATADLASTSTTSARFDSGITLNPGTNTITAGTFKGALSGNASTATTATKANQLTTARTIRTNLASTSTASFNGTANITPGVTGILPVANGGTGSSKEKYLQLTGGTISGSLAVNGGVITCSSNPLIQSSPWPNISINDSTREIAAQKIIGQVVDKDNKRFIALEAGAGESGERIFTINGRNREDTNWSHFLKIEEQNDNSIVAKLGSSPSNDVNNNEIVTAKWVNDKLTGYVTTTGNASSATKLATTRTINGTSFNGTANITTSNWGTARNITISDDDATNTGDAVSVNGSKNVTLKLPATIKASLSGNASTATKATSDSLGQNIADTYVKSLSVSGKTITITKGDGGKSTITTQDTNTDTKVTQTVTTTNAEYPLLICNDANKTTTSTTTARFVSGLTLNPSTKKITCNGLSGNTSQTSYVGSAKSGGSLLDFPDITSGAYAPFIRYKTTNGAMVQGGYQTEFGIYYLTDENIEAGKNTVAESLKFSESGVLTSSGGFKGNLSGNASTATKANQLTTARTIAIGGAVTGTATSFNGTANITIDTTRVNLEDAGIAGELPISHGGTGRTDGKAVGLVTSRTIDGVSFNGTANISHFGKCSTAAATAAKVVSCTGFTLATGARIIVQFTVTNTASSPTLNVNSTGAKSIVYRNSAISAGYLAANRVYEFVYDGTNYELIGDINTDTNTDTKVTQTVTTTNADYPILASATADLASTSTTTARFDSGITLNPGTNTITAGTFKGALSGNASTATKATSDSLGQNIADTYVKSLSVSGRTITITKGDGGKSTITTQDTNTDTKVTQTVSTTNSTYPILACATANATATTTTTSIFCKNIKINPSAGSITATAVYNAVWNDYAEFFPRGEETEVGDFIALDLNSDEERYIKASKYTSKSVGIHSNSFGHLIGGENPTDDQDFIEYNLPKYIPVGLVGRCYGKIIGKIHKGDFIVISDIPGVGRKYINNVDSVIDIIGMSCEDSLSDEIKLVKIKLN